MKYYRVEPAMKKSCVETEIYERSDGLRLSVEVGWRCGDYVIHVPETDEELQYWLDNRWGITKEEYDEDPDCYPLIPDPEEDDTLELEDWEHEMLSTWDGCWEDYDVYAPYNWDRELDEDEKEQILEVLTEEGSTALWEEYDEGHVMHGWNSADCTTVIYNGFTIEECDENGRPLEHQRAE